MNQPAKITFWPNGGVSVRDKDGNDLPELQRHWLLIYWDRLEQLGLDPTTIEFQGLSNGAWVRFVPFKHDNDWSYKIEKADS
jgi:hypothetical protein